MDTPEDIEFLERLKEIDPDFVSAYLGEDMGAEMSEKKVYYVSDCAEILGVCENTVLNHIKAGKLKAELIGKRWVIRKIDFDDYQSKMVIVKGEKDGRAIINFRSNLTKESEMANQDKLYVKATTQNVCDFLYRWEKNDSPGFSLRTICDDFNKVSEQPVNESQMSNILSSLHEKGIVKRVGKGIYRTPYFVDKEESEKEVAVETPISKRPTDDNYIHLKKNERLAVEAFIEKYANPERDFRFTIHELSREYPHLDRNKLGKACSNMCYTKTICKGRMLGEYVKPASELEPRKVTPAQQVDESISDKADRGYLYKIEQVMASNLPDDLKKKLIKDLANESN